MEVTGEDETSSTAISILVFLSFLVSQVNGPRVSLLWEGVPRRDVFKEIGHIFWVQANGALH